MGVNLWGASPLYVNPVNGLITLTKVLAKGKGVPVREGLKEAGVQIHESRPDWRDCVWKVYPVEFPKGNPIQQGECPFYPPLAESGETCPPQAGLLNGRS